MTEEVKAVETTENAAPQAGVETKTTVAPEVDALKFELAQIEEEKKLLAVERDNYKRGLLKAKGKIEEDFGDENETTDEKIARIVEEKLMHSREAQLEARKLEVMEKALKENAELKLSLKNRSQAPVGQGTNNESMQVQDHFFSEQQIADLKARGLDPEKVKKNMLKRV